jgi:hypothetical protein
MSSTVQTLTQVKARIGIRAIIGGETAARTGWTTDLVHPSRHTVAKIGLHLIEKMGNYTPVGSGDGGKKTSASPRLSKTSISVNCLVYSLCGEYFVVAV